MLISRVREGDEGAFGLLFERHHSAAIRVGKALVSGSRVSAEDCVAEAFTTTLSALQRGKGPDEFFRAYLYTTMRHSVQAANKLDSKSETVDDFEIIERVSREHSIDPMITRYETDVVRNAFAGLPERWQAVLWYSEIEGMKPAEVAPLLGLSAHGVSMLRKRAREGLRTAYLQGHLSAVTPGGACESVASKLGAFSRMTVAARDRKKIELHLQSCADCQAMSAEVQNVNRGLLGIIALLFLGGAADHLFGGVGRGTGATPGPVAARTGAYVQVSGVRISQLTAVLGGAAVVGVVLSFLLPNADVLVREGTYDAADTAEEITLRTEDFERPGAESTEEQDALESAPEDAARDSTNDEKSSSSQGPLADNPLIDPSRPLAPPLDPLPETPPPNDPLPILPPVVMPDPPPVTPPVTPPEVPPVTPPVNLVSNGGFDSPGIAAVDGKYYDGEDFDGWKMGPSTDTGRDSRTLQIWYPEMGEPGTLYASPFPLGPWARIMGTITQSVPTEVGKTYRVDYLTRSTGSDANQWAGGWTRGNRGYVEVNGARLQVFASDPAVTYTPEFVDFIATDVITRITFGNESGGAVGIDSVSVTLVD